MRNDEIVRQIAQSRLGDSGATRALVDDIRDEIIALTQVCISIGWQPLEVLDTVAQAVALAIETFERDIACSFADHARDCIIRAIRDRMSASAPASN